MNPRAPIVANTKVVSVLSGPEADFWPAGAGGRLSHCWRWSHANGWQIG